MSNAKQNANPKNRTSAGTSQTTEQRQSRRRNRGNGDVADWGSVDPDKLRAVIANVTSHGFAIRFGYTRDAGAYAVGIIGDGEPFTEFIRPTEDVDLYLTGLVDDYAK